MPPITLSHVIVRFYKCWYFSLCQKRQLWLCTPFSPLYVLNIDEPDTKMKKKIPCRHPLFLVFGTRQTDRQAQYSERLQSQWDWMRLGLYHSL